MTVMNSLAAIEASVGGTTEAEQMSDNGQAALEAATKALDDRAQTLANQLEARARAAVRDDYERRLEQRETGDFITFGAGTDSEGFDDPHDAAQSAIALAL